MDDLTLALELSQGQVMQVKQLRIIPPDPQQEMHPRQFGPQVETER